jgi:hypothetical protein
MTTEQPRLNFKILLDLSGVIKFSQKGFPMKISFALVTTATLLLSLLPARADTIYPMLPCRVFVDTGYIQIPNQCGSAGQFYPRRLFLRAVRRPSYFYCP